jgi:hypothetical protein
MLAPNAPIVQQFLTDTLVSWVGVTRTSLAISHTSMTAPLKPPAWYPEANRTLDNLRNQARVWNETESATVFNGLPQALIDYGNLFVSAAGDLRSSDKDGQLLILSRLYDMARGNQTRVGNLSDSLGRYVTNLRAARAEVDAALAAAMHQIQSEQVIAKALADRVNAIMIDIGGEMADAMNATKSAYTSGVSLVAAAMYFSVATALAWGPASPFVSLGIAVVGITYSAIIAEIQAQKIHKAMQEISDLHQKLDDEGQQIMGLRLIANSMRNLDDLIDRLSTPVLMAPLWQGIADDLNLVIAQVDAGVNAADLTEIATSSTAKTRWNAIIAQATNIQLSIANLSIAQPIDVAPAAQAA